MTVFQTKLGMKNNQNQLGKDNPLKINFKFKTSDPNQIALRRWLVMEIHCGRMTIQRAIEEFDFEVSNRVQTIKEWQTMYAPDIPLSLPIMTEKERQKVISLEKHIKVVEKQLEEAQMKATALNTLIDIAESKLSISIRKKFGTKQ